MKRFCTFTIGLLICYMTFAQHPYPSHSYLEIYDVPSRTHKVVKEFPYVIEAPNWTPDGKWLVVNKDGKLWKIAPDGSGDLLPIDTGDITQCNNDHVVTADGKKVVYIAYHDYEIAPDSHIADLNVQLRMISADGGEPEVLVDFFGGQGSLNVNSWSPDSRRFAYVSYRLTEEMTAPSREMAVQLYSVRELLGTPDLFARNHAYVLQRLSQMGFTAVEAASYEEGQFSGLTPERFRQAVEKAGLKILSSHTTRPLSPAELSSGDFIEAKSGISFS